MRAKEKLAAFEAHRRELIRQLEAGEIDKATFIEANHAFFEAAEHGPSQEMATVEECLYNYQYYNTLAKHEKQLSMALKYKDPFVAVEHRKRAEKIYRTKEKVTLQMLKVCRGQRIEAYFIKVSSKSLTGKLFEIVFHDLEQVILHSMDFAVRRQLMAMRCFDPKMRKSVIDDYINSLY